MTKNQTKLNWAVTQLKSNFVVTAQPSQAKSGCCHSPAKPSQARLGDTIIAKNKIINKINKIKNPTNFLLVQFSQLDCDWSMEYK